MFLFYRSKRRSFSIRAILFVLISSISFSVCPLTANLISISFSVRPLTANSNGAAQDNLKEKIKTKLDLLKVEQTLDSLPFLFDSDSLISDNEWEELELDLVLENWKTYKKTKFDLWGIKKLLRFAPQGSKEIIRYFVENDQAYEALNEIFDVVKDGQDALIAYWDEENLLHRDAKSFYYSGFGARGNKFLNSSTTALEISQALGAASPIVTLLTILGVTGLLQGFANSRLMGVPFNWKKSFLRGLKRPLVTHDPRPNVYKDGYDYRKYYEYYRNGTFGDRCIVGKHILEGFFKKFTGNRKVQGVLAGSISLISQGGSLAMFDYFSCGRLKNSVNKIRFLYKGATNLQHSMVKIAKMLRSLDKLKDLDSQLDASVLKTIKKYFKKEAVSQEFIKLLDLLDSDTFKSEASFWFSRGRVLNAHKLLTQIKGELDALLQSIALLGGYRAIVQMIREHQDSDVRYCFVEFIESDKPFVKMKNAWVPLLKEDNIVTNNVKLGVGGAAPNAIITGPNGGGKSTFMITVAFNVLLSRLGIAAADQAYMSDFIRIRTSLRPRQDIKSGLSSFMAEYKRAKTVKKTIDACNGNILVLLDEPYKGTVESEAASRVYKFGKEIAENDNCMLLMATHLRKPIELEKDVPGLFANYQMGYIETKSGTISGFKRTFKILDGSAIWWFDDAKKRAKFVDWLCEQEVQDDDED
ncbi:hypothetical protein ACFLYU_04505 [Candidatus Dependentiae bacterium]